MIYHIEASSAVIRTTKKVHKFFTVSIKTGLKIFVVYFRACKLSDQAYKRIVVAD